MKTLTFIKPHSNLRTDSMRVTVHRGKASKDREFVGSLYLDYAYMDKNQKLLANCSESEKIQCMDYLQVYNKMRRSLGSDNSRIKAFSVYLDEKLPELVYRVAEKAEAQGVAFYPQDVMTDALLAEMDKLSETLDLSGLFNQYQFKPRYTERLTPEIEEAHKHALINAVLTAEDKQGGVIEQFNARLKTHYGKQKQFSYEKLARLLADDNQTRIKIFWLSNSVDILQQVGVNPCALVPVAVVFEYWLLPRLKHYQEDEATAEFMSLFKVKKKELSTLEAVARQVYSKPVLKSQVFIVQD